MPEEVRNDKTLVLQAVKEDKAAIKYASESIKNEIGNNNPVRYLESQLFHTKLNQKLPNKIKSDSIKRKI
jgi:hypothetical protein